jgi:hypothetical protein
MPRSRRSQQLQIRLIKIQINSFPFNSFPVSPFCVFIRYFTLYIPLQFCIRTNFYFLVLVQKNDLDFLHERSANRKIDVALGVST